jgi:hypothetical protein
MASTRNSFFDAAGMPASIAKRPRINCRYRPGSKKHGIFFDPQRPVKHRALILFWFGWPNRDCDGDFGRDLSDLGFDSPCGADPACETNNICVPRRVRHSSRLR